jgi:hypothetical protein
LWIAILDDRTSSVWDSGVVGGPAVLVVPCGKISLDIKLRDREHWFHRCIYDEVVKETPDEVESLGRRVSAVLSGNGHMPPPHL